MYQSLTTAISFTFDMVGCILLKIISFGIISFREVLASQGELQALFSAPLN